MRSKTMELICKVQTYAWGKLGKSSSVAVLARGNNAKFIIDDEETYAEFWMGTHPNGPSTIASSGQYLRTWLESNPEALGFSKSVFGNDLSFLFKVLSVNLPLSIQAHPEKKHAEKLNKQFPDIYPDKNHKPELAVALSQFEVLAGFRPYHEIKQYFDDIPELRKLIPLEQAMKFLKLSQDKNLLKNCFESLMKQEESAISDATASLLNRLKFADAKTQSCQMYKLLQRLSVEFKGDVGIFCIYFMNYIVLMPGESLYIPPNLPHAYLSGDCVECMACSDNVVRAGFTQKFKDIGTLTSMLDYRGYTPSSLLLKGLPIDKHTLSFSPPILDFQVLKITIEKDCNYNLLKRTSASIILVLAGEGTLSVDGVTESIQLGSVYFVPAEKTVSVVATKDMVIFQASTNECISF